MASQVQNGKAFEFALANAYWRFLQARGIPVAVDRTKDWINCEHDFLACGALEQERFSMAAEQTIPTLCRLEPGLLNCQSQDDVLTVRLMPDSAGIQGDVRDVVFSRKYACETVPHWEIGISAKNNHEAVKHSRISPHINIGKEWLSLDGTVEYLECVQSVFAWVANAKRAGCVDWNDLGASKVQHVYAPLLNAFEAEMKELFYRYGEIVPVNLIQYLIGTKPFYKIIKKDASNIVIVRAFNFVAGLGTSYAGVKADIRPDEIPLPSRIVAIYRETENKVMMVMDGGWQVSFRIHNASTRIENSLKFDIQLVGNPPILFSQFLFAD